MTVDYVTKFLLNGSNEELAAILDVLWTYGKGSIVYFDFLNIARGEENIGIFFADDKERKMAVERILAQEGTVRLEAEGPFGRYALLSEIDTFRKMAEATPNAEFSASIEGSTSYNAQSVHVDLKDGILRTEYWCSATYDENAEAYEEYFTKLLPREEFCGILGLDESAISLLDYKDFISDNTAIIDAGCGIMDYDGFVDYMSTYTSDEITEEAFEKFCEVLNERDIMCRDDFDANDEGERFVVLYDAVNKCKIQ